MGASACAEPLGTGSGAGYPTARHERPVGAPAMRSAARRTGPAVPARCRGGGAMPLGVAPHDLAAVPLFAGLPPERMARLAAGASMHHLQAGEWLFHQGDPGDSLYVVTAGSVDIVEEPSHTVVPTLGRGQCI